MHEPEPQSDTPLELMGLPANIDVSDIVISIRHFQVLRFDASQHRDPLRVLLTYLADVSLSVR